MLQKQIIFLGVSTSSAGDNVGFIGVSSANHSVKLPTISLPFISVIEKFHYLKSSLSDGALDLIQTIEVSNENYDFWLRSMFNRYSSCRRFKGNRKSV